MGTSFFYQAFIYLSAAVIAVPIAKRLGLGSVLGYLIAGVLIGPAVFGFIGEEGQDVMHFAEFGVVLMLFIIGLELQPSLLWKMRTSILGLGGLQVLLTTIIITGLFFYFTDLHFKSNLAIGLTLALSSTAIVLQTLNEKGLLKSEGGQKAFSVLLFQDIAVIPILAILPLLSVYPPTQGHGHQHEAWIDSFSIVPRVAIVLGGILSIYIAGRFLSGPIFRLIAQTHLRELFTAAALLLIVAITLLMTEVGLSPALGTFLAGVVLAQSEFRHELETDIEPFKGLLLGLFFIAVGASVDFNLIATNPGTITAIVLGLIFVKFIVLFVLGRLFKMCLDSSTLFAFSLAQGGEFAFVLLSYGLQNGVLEKDLTNILIASVAISMAITPLLMLMNEKLIQPKFGTKEKTDKEDDIIDEPSHVIIAGFGRYGSTIGRFLQANGVHATYLDLDPNNVDLLRKLGLKVFYGDASRLSLLEAAGADEADLLIVAVDVPEKAFEIVHTAKKNFPNLKIISRTNSWDESYEMLDEGIDNVYREYLDTALRMASDALGILGHRKFQVERSMKKFRKHDEMFLRELLEHRHQENLHMLNVKQHIEDLESMILDDIDSAGKDKDAGWDTDSRRKAAEGEGLN
jgi:monovalent cation:proton antiporter-2 (CPA2) family protein